MINTVIFAATVNVPGYQPVGDDVPEFYSAHAAWQYLADERTDAEDQADSDESGPYSQTQRALRELGAPELWYRGARRMFDAAALADLGLAPDGTGTVYGPTPGYDGDHDLGLAYTVSPVTPLSAEDVRRAASEGDTVIVTFIDGHTERGVLRPVDTPHVDDCILVEHIDKGRVWTAEYSLVGDDDTPRVVGIERVPTPPVQSESLF